MTSKNYKVVVKNGEISKINGKSIKNYDVKALVAFLKEACADKPYAIPRYASQIQSSLFVLSYLQNTHPAKYSIKDFIRWMAAQGVTIAVDGTRLKHEDLRATADEYSYCFDDFVDSLFVDDQCKIVRVI